MTSPRQAPKAAEISLDEMIQAIDLIIRYTQGQSLDQFQAVGNEEKQDTVIRPIVRRNVITEQCRYEALDETWRATYGGR